VEGDALFDVYARLWRCAESDGAFVDYYGIGGVGENGFFHAREGEGRKPWIAIYRPHYSEDGPTRARSTGVELSDDELRAELATLAHEYGHLQSWRRSRDAGGEAREAWLAYQDTAVCRDAIQTRELERSGETFDKADFHTRLRAANLVELSAEDRQRIIDEETTAWRYGREVLVELGYDGLDEYDRRAAAGPKVYRYHLGMVTLEEVPEWAR
jgi:hypothetical protein